MERELKCPLSAEELAAAHNAMLDKVQDWVTGKYPNIRLATVERNIAAFIRIKEYDDACNLCMGTGQCPSLDGNRMNGRLDSDGVVTIWMEPCPHGYKVPRGGQQEKQEEKRWSKKG